MTDLLSSLRARAEATPGSVVFRDDHGAITAAALLRRVGATARRLAGLRHPIGILLPNAIDFVVADLACKWTGRTAVPLPDLFSAAQLAHVARDAGIGTALTDAALAPRATALAASVIVIDAAEAEPPALAQGWTTIAYSSGSTGTPKGAIHGDRQMTHSARALARAAAATAEDIYLSVMPMALLLEQLSAIHLPLLVGGNAVLSTRLTRSALLGDGATLAAAIQAARPSVLSLVPHLLRVWLWALDARGMRPPESLRLVAVGGAPVPTALARDAWSRGIPVHEGYGLTECCAVVALNRPGARAEGTVGKPLDGVRVDVVDGEIVVSGPTVMDGHLNGTTPQASWATGDLGTIDRQGNLVVRGRRDAVIRTALGRNIHPEWIEAMISGDPRVRRCVVLGDGLPWPAALLEPSASGREWLAAGGDAAAIVRERTEDAPDYARPRQVVVLPEGGLGDPALLTANGRPRRAAIAQRHAASIQTSEGFSIGGEAGSLRGYERLLRETATQRREFLEIPVIRRAVASGVSRELYVAFLEQAYHHVKHTCPLLETAASRCDADTWLHQALRHYVAEEKGHDEWILGDVAAMGGDAEAVRNGTGRPPCRAMVAHAYEAIASRGPAALLGMVHVLEGMSVLLAEQAAASIRRSLAPSGPHRGDAAGFRYLTSHGALDVEHVAFFRSLVDRLDDPETEQAVIDTAKAVYRLYGDIFRDLDAAIGTPDSTGARRETTNKGGRLAT